MQKRSAAMVFILITLFLDILGIGIVIPVLPELIKQFVGGSESSAAVYFGPLAAVYALMQFVFAPILGSLSDRFGRRPIILIALSGLAVDYLIQGFAPSIVWLFVGRILAGIMGASFTAANAYIADISTPENRAQNFGLIGVAFGLGFIFGPALGGLLGGIWIRLPFFVAAGLVLINLLYGLFVLPESLKPENRSEFSWKKANPVGSILLLKNYPIVASLAATFVLTSLAQRGLETTWVLYTGYKFGWGEQTNGLTLAMVGVMAVIVQGFLIRPVIKRLGERRAIILSLGLSVFSFFIYGIATEWLMYVAIIVGALSGIAGPAVQGLVAGSVRPDEQGKVQGALTSLISLTSVFAPLIFTTGLFGYFTSEKAPFVLPGAPFFLGSLLFLLSLLMLSALFRRLPETPQPHV
ncbi:MAG: TCR/Tet family MFS transporter [Trueperaceae bacterium]|nr:TCR/Tet family MFS transporter [Trueperaceae bacterium]